MKLVPIPTSKSRRSTGSTTRCSNRTRHVSPEQIVLKIQVIINPAAGGREPILNTLNQVFRAHDVEWDVSITHRSGDATQQAREAVERGVDLVAGYGGDGTQMEVANGLFGSSVPQGILPGGTGNAMAFELGIPRQLEAAARLLCTSSVTRGVDLARVGEQLFMLRAYTGPRPETVASREEKDRLGLLAYPLATLRVLTQLEPTRYRIDIDGEVIEDVGLACFVFNAGASGGIPAALPKVSAVDGLLDVFVFNRENLPPPQLAAGLLGQEDAELRSWQGRKITIEADPPQALWLDGEPGGETPCTIELLPSAAQIVTGPA